MPTNVSPEYKKAEEAYRQAREPKDRLDCLKQMLSTIPKHKGTEHLQADIKSRIKDLTEELAGPKKGGKRSGPALAIRPEGAAQLALLGPPNSGKSALHLRLTGSRAQSGPGPFITQFPEPGMLPFEDVAFQLLDLPSMSPEHSPPWIASSLQSCDAALLVVDLADPACVENVQFILDTLEGKKVSLVADWPALESGADEGPGESDTLDDPFRIELPTLLVANKSDLLPDPEEVAVLEELLDVHYPTLRVSAETGQGLGELAPWLFKALGVVRVYTKAPGKDVERDRPFTVRQGDTVLDVARLVHKDIAEGFRFARMWGAAVFDGQQVGAEQPVSDGDVVELHSR
ncbi:TGS domain-containing protein [Thioalkalivibrio sp. XN279]|uniref:TGS domain-containing protein n=1 Tax=Thioalkalivibrio sp. XN279 TaxID=2714953 RepID=UPI00140816D9|nr:TGS domain-containing protein [Thioalkalivibrio sp. XN279]NHA13500.1 TGS domain-containing protein [Thioalkalivibrio sp. XN279]